MDPVEQIVSASVVSVDVLLEAAVGLINGSRGELDGPPQRLPGAAELGPEPDPQLRRCPIASARSPTTSRLW